MSQKAQTTSPIAITKTNAYDIARTLKKKLKEQPYYVVKNHINTPVKFLDEQQANACKEDNTIVLYAPPINNQKETKTIKELAEDIYKMAVIMHVDKDGYRRTMLTKHHWEIIVPVDKSITSKRGAIAYFGGAVPFAHIKGIAEQNGQLFVKGAFITSLDQFVKTEYSALINWGTQKFIQQYRLKVLDEDTAGVNNTSLATLLEDTAFGLYMK